MHINVLKAAGEIATPIAATASPGGSPIGGLQVFEGFLKSVGHVVGVLLSDVVKYAVPIVTVISVTSTPASAAEEAFAAALLMVLNTVVLIEQKWASLGSAADSQKLADVLQIVEQPIALLFAQAGYSVDVAYVTNLVNAVVALLNAQPAVPFPVLSSAAAA